MSETLTSPQNPKIKAALALRERRARDRESRTLVEGYAELSLALASGARPFEVFYCPQYFGHPDEAALLRKAGAVGARLYEVEPRLFAKLAYRENPDGWLGVLPRPGRALAGLALRENPLIVLAESVEKPGNLGAMLRAGDAAGSDALVATDSVTDWGNPNVIRASKGTVFSVPVVETTTADMVAWLRKRSIRLVAATPAASTVYFDADLRGPLVLAVGAEKRGLSRALLEAADESVLVPMSGAANSLNVAAVAALLIYEALRQRRT